MATAASKQAVSQAGKIAQYQKYTVQPTGIWARINNFLAVDPKRSTGIPMNPQFRNPTPGGNDPLLYDEPVTVPAADLAENAYWKRDTRRAYPRPSIVSQPDVVALLTVGSAGQPKEDVTLIGDAGSKQLVAAQEEGQKGLSAHFQRDKNAWKGVLKADGMPPLPASMHQTGKRYEMLPQQSYGTSYTCRTFE